MPKVPVHPLRYFCLPQTDYLLVEVAGDYNEVGDAIHFWQYALNHGRRTHRLLIRRGPGALADPPQMLLQFGKLAQMASDNWRIAIVLCDASRAARFEPASAIAGQNGLDMRAFSDETVALSWLLRPTGSTNE